MLTELQAHELGIVLVPAIAKEVIEIERRLAEYEAWVKEPDPYADQPWRD